jgi:hypothetical protein
MSVLFCLWAFVVGVCGLEEAELRVLFPALYILRLVAA